MKNSRIGSATQQQTLGLCLTSNTIRSKDHLSILYEKLKVPNVIETSIRDLCCHLSESSEAQLRRGPNKNAVSRTNMRPNIGTHFPKRVSNFFIADLFKFYSVSVSVTFWCGSGSGSCSFRLWPSRRQQIKKKKYFLLITFWRYIYITLRNKMSQNSRNKGFSLFVWWWKDLDPFLWLTDPDPGGPKTYGSYIIPLLYYSS